MSIVGKTKNVCEREKKTKKSKNIEFLKHFILSAYPCSKKHEIIFLSYLD